jgi:glyoxylase-like metal-dependent hydrolase (beta-lactamase superfamily II)
LGGKVKYIINTHFHFDHTGANEAIRKATGAKILIHEREKSFVNFKPDKFIKDKERITIGEDVLEVVHTPGHTKGGICLVGEKYVFTGDTVFKNGYGRTDLPGGSPEEMLSSLQKLKKLLKPGIIVCPGHGDSFEIKQK